MSDLKVCHVRNCVAIVICASMILGMLCLGAVPAKAAPDNAVLKGVVKIGAAAAPDTLIMYTLDREGTPYGNSTVSDASGNYELWVEGGHTYYVYFANGGSMFNTAAKLQTQVSVGETEWVNASLTAAPERTVTVKGLVTNASDGSPVTGGHVLGLRALMGGEPDYVNWTVANSTGYYEVKVLPGLVMAAVFDAPGYYPGMAPNMGSIIPKPSSAGDTLWLNLSLEPFTGYTVNVTGRVTTDLGSTALPGATVSAFIENMGLGTSNTTNATGHYLVHAVEGNGGVRASAAGYVSLEWVGHLVGNMTVDFDLPKNDCNVYGWVLDEATGLPVPNATVTADTWLGFGYGLYNETVSGPDGSYNMSLSEEAWSIRANAVAYGESVSTVTILAGSQVLHNISLKPESSVVKGYITNVTNGLPIEDVGVMISGIHGSMNFTSTDAAGFYSMNCLPNSYLITFIAGGYMYEQSMEYIVVGPGRTLWVNHSLTPATMNLFGKVTDAITGAPVSGAVVMVTTYSVLDPDFMMLMNTVSDVNGKYSMKIAPGEPFYYVDADCDGYIGYSDTFSLPIVTDYRLNISLLPSSYSTYTLQGNVTDSSSGLPIEGAQVAALYGEYWISNDATNVTGAYSLVLPTANLTLQVSMDSYLPVEVDVPIQPAGSVVTLDIALELDSIRPLLSNVSAAPDRNVSTHNPANVSFDVTEEHFKIAELIFAKVLNTTGDTAWICPWDTYVAGLVSGNQFVGTMEWMERSAGNWTFWIPDWDSTSDSFVLLTDATGAQIVTNRYEGGIEGTWLVGGYYYNSSMMFPSPAGDAVFDVDGNYLGFSSGGPIWPGTESDDTGMFYIKEQHLQVNLTTSGIINFMSSDSEALEVHTTHLQLAPIAYPSGDFAVVAAAVDLAENVNITVDVISVDNDDPVVDAGANQSEIVGLSVDFNGTLTTDNVGIVNYTWTIDDGGVIHLSGPLANHTFTTVGNHTVTLTATDGAGNSASANIVVEILADQIPVADAGLDEVVDEDTVVAFNGTASHDDIGVANYTWTVVGSTIVMYGPKPNCTFSAPGMYHVRLVVKDTIGQASVFDEVVIAVSDVTPPVANAGPDEIINVGTAMAFDGSGSTDNGAITTYLWTFTDGITKSLGGQGPSYTFTTKGNYTVTLTVTDSEGNSDSDTMVVRVNAAPAADAGSDSEVAKGTEVTFDGSGSSDDMTIENYTWSFTYQGATHTLYGANPKFAFEEPGTYTVQLTVRDVGGLTNSDTVVVTVTGKSSGASFLTQYWWLLMVVVAVIVVAAVVVLMRKGKGKAPAAAASAPRSEELPPPPSESDELEFPPPSDEEL